jgi:hypothetical protein
MPRVKHQKHMYKEEVLEYSKEELRFGTPEIVAQYRAKKLKCNCLLEVGSSIGFQTFPFAEQCKHVIAVEIDRTKIERARKNAKLLGFTNIYFVHGDALEKKTIERVKDICEDRKLTINNIFLDTERKPDEKERSLKTIKPSIPKFLELYSHHSENIAIELPPHMQHEKLKPLPEHEKEYISLNGHLNRLTLCFGKLKKVNTSLVLLPENKRIEKKDNKNQLKQTKEITEEHKYLHEINPAVIVSDLLSELFPATQLFATKKKLYLLSSRKINSSLLQPYKILEITDKDNLTDALNNLNTDKITLRGNIAQDEYFNLKNKIEKDLRGKNKYDVFFFDNIIITEKL